MDKLFCDVKRAVRRKHKDTELLVMFPFIRPRFDLNNDQYITLTFRLVQSLDKTHFHCSKTHLRSPFNH